MGGWGGLSLLPYEGHFSVEPVTGGPGSVFCLRSSTVREYELAGRKPSGGWLFPNS